MQQKTSTPTKPARAISPRADGALFLIWCLRCGREVNALKTHCRARKGYAYPIWQNRCMVCGELYDALPPPEGDDGERGSEVHDMAPDSGLLLM